MYWWVELGILVSKYPMFCTNFSSFCSPELYWNISSGSVLCDWLLSFLRVLHCLILLFEFFLQHFACHYEDRSSIKAFFWLAESKHWVFKHNPHEHFRSILLLMELEEALNGRRDGKRLVKTFCIRNDGYFWVSGNADKFKNFLN